MSVKRYVLDENALMGGMEMFEDDEGDYVLHTDYAAILARHNALVEAVAWERECEELHGIITELYCNVSESAPEEDEISRTYFAARAEVDRLLEEK